MSNNEPTVYNLVCLSLSQTEARSDMRLSILLRDEIWPRIPADQMGVRISKQAEESILGYGEEGV